MKFKSITIYLSVILVNSLSLNAQTTINLIPDSDAAIGFHDNYNTSDNNYGTASQNAAYSIPGARGGVNNNRALIKFDLSSIPAGSNISSAKLNLYALGPIGTLSGHTGEANSAVLQRPNEATLSPSSSPLQDYTVIDVTALVQDMIDNTNHGFLLKLINEEVRNALLFASLNCGDSTKFPLLKITYDNCLKVTSKSDAAIGFHDNYNTSDNNYGTASQNAAYSIPGSRGGVNNNRALIKFDLSSIPTGSNISSAKLNLYALGPIGTLSGHTGEANSAVLQRITQNWNDSIVTWDSQPTATNQNEATLLPSTSPLQDYTDIDVTALVQDMIDNNNYGFLLKLNNEDITNALLFASSNVSDSNKHPKLEVCFSRITTCTNKLTQDTTVYFVDDTKFSSLSSRLLSDSSVTKKTVLGCDSVVNYYTNFVYNATYCSDTTNIKVLDTVTTNVTVLDTVTVTNTVMDTITTNIIVTDTNYVNVNNYVDVYDSLIIDLTRSITAVDEPFSSNMQVKVYPNPASQLLFLEVLDAQVTSAYSFELINVNGSIVADGLLNKESTSIDISSFSGGTYYVQFYDAQLKLVNGAPVVIRK